MKIDIKMQCSHLLNKIEGVLSQNQQKLGVTNEGSHFSVVKSNLEFQNQKAKYCFLKQKRHREYIITHYLLPNDKI